MLRLSSESSSESFSSTDQCPIVIRSGAVRHGCIGPSLRSRCHSLTILSLAPLTYSSGFHCCSLKARLNTRRHILQRLHSLLEMSELVRDRAACTRLAFAAPAGWLLGRIAMDLVPGLPALHWWSVASRVFARTCFVISASMSSLWSFPLQNRLQLCTLWITCSQACQSSLSAHSSVSNCGWRVPWRRKLLYRLSVEH